LKSEAIVKIDFHSEKILKMIFDALKLEAKKLVSHRARISIQCRKTQLILKVEAKDTVALRAALNSFLHWISLVNDVYSVVSSLG
jgi:tRNA threonylcarbamoyladenosine modification (KEOPS) complex  Pcc1 subunit